MDTPLVSIIIPCYNQAEYLPEALDSVLAQTMPQWECVVVNDASPDNTAMIANSYSQRDSRIRLIDLPQNGGLANARNSGIAATSAPFILPLDADDKLHPAYLERVLPVLKGNPIVKVAYTDAQHFGINSDYAARPNVNMRLLCSRNLFQPTALYRRIDFEKTAGYRKHIFAYEDWDMWLQLIDRPEQAVRIPQALFFQRIKNFSMIVELRSNAALEKKIRKQIYFYNREKYQVHAPEIAYSYERKLSEKDFKFMAKYRSKRLLLRFKKLFG